MSLTTNNQQQITNYYSNGKLLISAEYLVLDGAIALALPTRFGQDLIVTKNNSNKLVWKSFDNNNTCWFEASFDLNDFMALASKASYGEVHKITSTLQNILNTARKLNPKFLTNSKGLEVQTHLTFPNEWGLGTSSTLINSIASWAKINAFELLEKSFGGSGYDIACAQNNHAILYTRNGVHPSIETIEFAPSFKENIFFVYLNQKQDSKEGIQMYRNLKVDKSKAIEKINSITLEMTQSNTLAEFETLILEHESLLSELLGITTVKEKLFSDFDGQVKSLGAWGGDFVMVTGEKENSTDYFKNKGYTTILSYQDMILF